MKVRELARILSKINQDREIILTCTHEYGSTPMDIRAISDFADTGHKKLDAYEILICHMQRDKEKSLVVGE